MQIIFNAREHRSLAVAARNVLKTILSRDRKRLAVHCPPYAEE